MLRVAAALFRTLQARLEFIDNDSDDRRTAVSRLACESADTAATVRLRVDTDIREYFGDRGFLEGFSNRLAHSLGPAD
jgi:hypothetical protein